MPTEQDLDAMTRFNDELVESGAMLAGEGFLASADGARLTYTDGAVTSSRTLRAPRVPGRRLLDHPGRLSRGGHRTDEAGTHGQGDEVEIRQIVEAEDFGEELTPELREREERQRSQDGGERQAQSRLTRRSAAEGTAGLHPPRPSSCRSVAI